MSDLFAARFVQRNPAEQKTKYNLLVSIYIYPITEHLLQGHSGFYDLCLEQV